VKVFWDTVGNVDYKVVILGQLVEGDDVRTDFFEFANNHVQDKSSIFWITGNIIKVLLRVLFANFVYHQYPSQTDKMGFENY
jgi:hypothetical protein